MWFGVVWGVSTDPSINLVSLNGSDFTTVRETDKKYRLFLSHLFLFP